MTQQPAPFAALFCLGLAASCGTGRGANYLDVGSDDAGSSFVVSGADAGQADFDAYIDQGQVAVKFITLSCSGDCATVEAFGTGGYPPYTYAWDDGSTSATRRVCPTSSANYSVKVTDSGTAGEVARPAQTVQVPLTADVLTCPDAGLLVACSDGGTLGPGVLSGRYVGTVSCPPEGGVIDVPTADGGESSGTVTLDLSVNGTAVGGTLYFIWSVGAAIAWQAGLKGALDCPAGDLQATWENAQWGLPTTGPDGGMAIIPTGMGTGSITAAPVGGSLGAISGEFDFTPTSGGFCRGTYTAAFMP
jgi:hypothetical protein